MAATKKTLSKKTMVLLTPELHRRLKSIAKKRHTSVGALVREACERSYSGATVEERLAAVKRMSEMNLPVSDVATMKRESIAEAKPL